MQRKHYSKYTIFYSSPTSSKQHTEARQWFPPRDQLSLGCVAGVWRADEVKILYVEQLGSECSPKMLKWTEKYLALKGRLARRELWQWHLLNSTIRWSNSQGLQALPSFFTDVERYVQVILLSLLNYKGIVMLLSLIFMVSHDQMSACQGFYIINFLWLYFTFKWVTITPLVYSLQWLMSQVP